MKRILIALALLLTASIAQADQVILDASYPSGNANSDTQMANVVNTNLTEVAESGGFLDCLDDKIKKKVAGAWTCVDESGGVELDPVYSGDPAFGITAPDIVDWDAKQERVSDECAAGSSIRAIAVDGTVTCEVDDGSGGTPGGADTQVQFNDGGVFGGDTAFLFNKATDLLTVYGLHVTNDVTIDGNLTADGITVGSAAFNMKSVLAAILFADADNWLNDLSTDLFHVLSASEIDDRIAAGGGGVGGYVATPTYSDETCTTGQYSWDGTYYYGCEATDKWDRFAVTWAAWSNPTPTLYTLTITPTPTNGVLTGISLNCGSGNIDCTTDVVGGSAFLITTAGDVGYQDAPTWGGTGGGDVSGSGSSWSITMNAAKSVSATFQVAPPSASFYLSCDTLGVTEPDTGTTMVNNSGFTQTTGQTGNAYEASSPTDSYVSMAMADIDIEIGTIDLYVRPDYSGAPASNQEYMYGNADFTITHLSTGQLRFTYKFKSPEHVSWSPTSGTYYHIIARWDNVAGEYSLEVDGTENQLLGVQTIPAPTAVMFDRQYQTDSDFAIDEIKIYKSVLP